MLALSPEHVRRTLTRLAYEVVERNRGASELAIVGIRRRGVALAEALAEEISAVEGRALPVSALDTTPYRDDLEGNVPEEESAMRGEIAGRDVLLVDDVLFTGRTARAALDALTQHGRPRSVQLAILIDRGHREYPIRPDYVGRTLQTDSKERVRVDPDSGFAVYVDDG
ncbi:MAG: bifunctional pyr operon transcriptional regulator/uracil phosphoribosyltransferase PyrR [Bacteroidetes bacterium QS_9_68_14]|nr:MAG: bifunctional pyr operon transcriptional regulator/uracil phosphoribosyltransferase PyrR [Bacteroidetes bacterium QS_9_68_14]